MEAIASYANSWGCMLWSRLCDGGGAHHQHRLHGLPDGCGPDGGAVLHLHPHRYWLLIGCSPALNI